MLNELHQGHPGIFRMKALAQSHVWWPGLDKAIEECTKSCMSCQTIINAPAKSPLHPWAWATAPWESAHVDFGSGCSNRVPRGGGGGEN